MQLYEFYKAVKQQDYKAGSLAVTVTEGELFGKKALLSEQSGNWQAVWQSGPDAWTSGYLGRLAQIAEENKSGMHAIDGGSVFCEFLRGEKKIVICGGGHVSIPMIQIGRMIGCRVTVLEDRPEFADRAAKAGASEVICEPFAQGLERISADVDTFFVVVTRGHRYDQICLESIVKKEHAYIGMMGSRQRTIIVKQKLLDDGFPKETVNSIHTPIGLDIGAQTPEEIAVSVMAEIIQVKNRMPGGGFPREILEAVLSGAGSHECRVLATIIKRQGSAPREIGTKMLVRPDGSCAGTIGGGSAEARIMEHAVHMLQTGQKQMEIIRVDLTGSKAAEEGMVCGGMIEVMLEPI